MIVDTSAAIAILRGGWHCRKSENGELATYDVTITVKAG